MLLLLCGGLTRIGWVLLLTFAALVHNIMIDQNEVMPDEVSLPSHYSTVLNLSSREWLRSRQEHIGSQRQPSNLFGLQSASMLAVASAPWCLNQDCFCKLLLFLLTTVLRHNLPVPLKPQRFSLMGWVSVNVALSWYFIPTSIVETSNATVNQIAIALLVTFSPLTISCSSLLNV